MRYYKGLGIGHIYTRLKADDALLTNSSVDRAQHIPILVEDGPGLSLPETNNGIVPSQDSSSDSEGSENEDDDPDVNSDVISNHNGNSEGDLSDNGSVDSSDLEYLDTYSNCGSEDDD